MSGLDRTRWAIGALGLVAGTYGAYLLLTRQRTEQVVDVGRWLIGGVLLHDVALAGLVLAAGWSVRHVVPCPARAPVTVGAVVLGSLTLIAIPVLGRYGAKPDNPTLLDRNYGLGWAVVAGLVVVAVVVASLLRARAQRPVSGPPDDQRDSPGQPAGP